jgi:hypothetical protein
MEIFNRGLLHESVRANLAGLCHVLKGPGSWGPLLESSKLELLVIQSSFDNRRSKGGCTLMAQMHLERRFHQVFRVFAALESK